MSLPIITVSYPTSHMSRQRREEFLASQRNFLEREFNRLENNYHILVFESDLIAPIFEIHNVDDDSSDSLERFKERINKILEFSKRSENLMTKEEYDLMIYENSFLRKLRKLFNI